MKAKPYMIFVFGGLLLIFLWLGTSFETEILNGRNYYVSSNTSNTSYTHSTAQRNDNILIEYLRERVLISPSRNKYNLSHPEKQDSSQFKQGLLLREFFNNKKNGTFIEAGALDGEKYSNSLILERDLGWTGLLVEPSPNFFKILQKNRKAHAAHCCLSLTQEHSEQILSLLDGATFVINKFAPLDYFDKVGKSDCYPLYSLMVAMNLTTLDLLSLDLEGAEVKVLETIPWHKVDIKTIIVEVNHIPEGKTYLKNYMARKNYRLEKELHIDYFFIKIS